MWSIKAKTNGLQTQIDGKQNIINTSARLNANLISDGSVSNTQFNYLNDVTNPIQSQIGNLTILNTNNYHNV